MPSKVTQGADVIGTPVAVGLHAPIRTGDEQHLWVGVLVVYGLVALLQLEARVEGADAPDVVIAAAHKVPGNTVRPVGG